MSVLIDSYSESNYDSVILYGSITEVGQTFTIKKTISPTSAKFYLKKSGSPTGNIVAKIWPITGTSGSSGAPSGTVLAISDAVSASTLTTSLSLVTFNFTGTDIVSLSPGNYGLSCEYNGSDASNLIEIGADSSSPSHAGNAYTYTSSNGYQTYTVNDFIFYVYGEITPAASFKTSQTNAKTNETITFTDISSYTPTSWSWDFGDDSTDSTSQNPTHSYDTAGTYTVTLTSTNAAGSDTATTTITVEDKPTLTGISSLTGVSKITF